MLTPSNNKLALGVKLLVVVLSLGVFAFPPQTTTAATTKLELTQKVSRQLSNSSSNTISGASVLGQNTTIPFFPRGYVYPIAQLGNCTNQRDCFEFCELSENLDICAMVSYRNGYMSEQQLTKTLAFSSYLRSGYLASCDDLGSCIQVCDSQQAQGDCSMLALSMEHGAMVLGAEDTTPTYQNFDNQCLSVDSCNLNLGDNNILGIMNSLIVSGQAPSQCTNAFSCQTYCTANPNSACEVLYTKIGMQTGMIRGDTPRGRVLQVSVDNGVQYELLQDPTTESPTTTPAPYEPQGYLSCIVQNQGDSTPQQTNTTQTNTPQDADLFADNVQTCDKQFSATDQQIENFGKVGQTKLDSSMSKISECILGLDSSLALAECLNY